MHIKHLLAVLGLGLLGSAALAEPVGTAFTYQGRLTDGSNAANGSYDLDFALFAVPDGGSQLGISMTLIGHPVSNGLFTVTLDFGASPFAGDARWLQIQVRTNGGRTPPPFSLLTPRQQLTPSPNALYAASAGSAVTASNVAPFAITAGGIADGTITAGKLASGQVVKSLNGLFDVVTLSAGTNVTLAASGNDLKISATPGTVVTNVGWGISGNSGTTAANFLGTTDGQPLELRVTGQRALRLEPGFNGSPNVVGGSVSNRVAAGVIGATIAGGGNSIGSPNRVEADHGSIGGGLGNLIQPTSAEATIGGGGLNLIQSNGWDSVIGGGVGNTIKAGAFISTLGGGSGNSIQQNAPFSVIGGGVQNVVQPNAAQATIGGGGQNSIQVGAQFSTISGGASNSIQTNSAFATISGGATNIIQPNADRSAIGGGSGNNIQANAPYSTIGGGVQNVVQTNAYRATIGGGGTNLIRSGAYDSVVAGGSDNQIGAGAYVATLSGGVHNRVNGAGATVPGGNSNEALGVNSFAAGTQAHALHEGAFVWADAHYADFHSTYPNQFLVRAPYVGINTNAPQATLHVVPSVVGLDAALFEGEVKVQVLTITGGADVAEPFKISGREIPKGAVVIIDEENPGQLKLSQRAYDSRVAGIVSGANGIQPGLSLSQQGVMDGGQQVALSGRVYVRADASTGAIRPGDLLTTAALPGHAMKVTDHLRAQGAILGKAMSALPRGQGLVLVLVTLQ